MRLATAREVCAEEEVWRLALMEWGGSVASPCGRHSAGSSARPAIRAPSTGLMSCMSTRSRVGRPRQRTSWNSTASTGVGTTPSPPTRRARSALLSMQPTTTGSATAISLIYPELKGKLNGHAVRVPVLNASLTDCVFELQRAVTVDEINDLFRAAATGPLAGILGFEARPLVSADYANDTRSSIVDGPSTMVTDETLLKVYAWYDNEVGYACRMVDLANIVIERSR